MVREHYRQGLSSPESGALLGRSGNSVHGVRVRMGLVRTRPIWSAEDEAAVERHFYAGISTTESGNLLGRDRGAIAGKRVRMGLVRFAATTPGRIPSAGAPVDMRVFNTNQVVGAPKRCDDLPEIAPPDWPNVTGKILSDLRARECRWPLQPTREEATSSTLFCAAPVKPGKAFCWRHAAIAYVQPEPGAEPVFDHEGWSRRRTARYRRGISYA